VSRLSNRNFRQSKRVPNFCDLSEDANTDTSYKATRDSSFELKWCPLEHSGADGDFVFEWGACILDRTEAWEQWSIGKDQFIKTRCSEVQWQY